MLPETRYQLYHFDIIRAYTDPEEKYCYNSISFARLHAQAALKVSMNNHEEWKDEYIQFCKNNGITYFGQFSYSNRPFYDQWLIMAILKLENAPIRTRTKNKLRNWEEHCKKIGINSDGTPRKPMFGMDNPEGRHIM